MHTDASCSSHPDFNRRYRSSTGSASWFPSRVADYHRRFGLTPTPGTLLGLMLARVTRD